jgi:hypothetical protein
MMAAQTVYDMIAYEQPAGTIADESLAQSCSAP